MPKHFQGGRMKFFCFLNATDDMWPKMAASREILRLTTRPTTGPSVRMTSQVTAQG